MFGSKDDEVAKFTSEPPRASLTEPPPGYQTPSPDQPYGLGKATTKYVRQRRPSRKIAAPSSSGR